MNIEEGMEAIGYIPGSISVSTRACHTLCHTPVARESWVRLPARELVDLNAPLLLLRKRRNE